MKVSLTGWNGFLSKKLRERTEIKWQEDVNGSDILFLMGSPTFTGSTLDKNDSQVMHNYVKNTINKIDSYSNPIIFASTTGVNDIDKMRFDRIQQRMLKNDFTNIEFEDNYLFVDEFVNTTINNILNFNIGIVHYKLTKMTLPKLMLLGK